MKIPGGFFAFTFIFINLSSAYAGDRSGFSDQFLVPSLLSVVNVQVMYNDKGQLKLTHGNLLSAANSIQSNDQLKPYKDRRKAFIRSLILPGAGELYLGKRTLAKAFLFTEITLWMSYFAFREYSQWIRDDAFAFAASHSGAKINGKPSQFFVDIGNYLDVYQYNEAKQRMFQFEKVYTEKDYFWSWDSDNTRREFKQMRIASDRALNRSIFVLGGILANHLISAIHSTWQTHRYNKKLDKMSDAEINFYIGADYSKGVIIFSIQKEF